MDSLTHAREWLTVATTLKMLDHVSLSMTKRAKAANSWLNLGATHHVRELFLFQIITNYGSSSNPFLTYLLDNYDFVFIPVVNPDGYEYTWTTVSARRIFSSRPLILVATTTATSYVCRSFIFTHEKRALMFCSPKVQRNGSVGKSQTPKGLSHEDGLGLSKTSYG